MWDVVVVVNVSVADGVKEFRRPSSDVWLEEVGMGHRDGDLCNNTIVY